MAVNMYSGFWSLVVCVLVTVVVSLFTRPKPDAELKNLVMGLTPLPDEGPCPWYEKPIVWAAGHRLCPRRRQHHLLVDVASHRLSATGRARRSTSVSSPSRAIVAIDRAF